MGEPSMYDHNNGRGGRQLISAKVETGRVTSSYPTLETKGPPLPSHHFIIYILLLQYKFTIINKIS